MKKIFIILALAFLAACPAMAQNGFNVPYSQYGIGECNMPFNMPFAASMGGVSYTRSGNNFINPFNPASYAQIEKETFVFDMGLNIEMSTLKDRNSSLFDADGNLSYLTIGMPVTRWWKTSLGLMPYSDVNYQSVQSNVDTTLFGTVKNVYEGVGEVSQIFWGNGFNILKNLSVGVNVNYLYGSVQKAISYDFDKGDTSMYFINSRRLKNTYISNLNFDLGMQYYQPLGQKYTLGLGLVVKPHRTMSVKDNSLVYTYMSDESLRDTIFPAPGVNNEYLSTLEQPFSLGVGLSLARNGRWLVAADFTYAASSGLKYTENDTINLFGRSVLRYDNDLKGALGFELTGDKNSSKYFQRISWRAGVHYEQGKLILDLNGVDTKLNEWGLGCGASLPMRKGRSVLNLSLGYRSFGSVDPLQRNCFTFGVSIGSCESWFVKRKYN
ncbi:MAG: hypothetical protein MJZ51_06675 [Bacteroidales bacterium]|nr:hypothetical protein [Bacteroidales bacterium]